MKKKYNLLFIISIILFAGLSYIIYNYQTDELSFVSISINPEVELAVDNHNIVKDVIPLNNDADVLLSDLDLIGVDIALASEKIIDAAMETGYIDEYRDDNIIVITSTIDDEKDRQKLEEKIRTRLNNRFEQKKVYPVLVVGGVDDNIKHEADTYEISNGKMLLIEKAVSTDPELSKVELAKMTVKEIGQKIQDYVRSKYDNREATKAEIKADLQQTKENLKQTYKEKVDGLKEELLNKNAVDTSNMTQEEINQATTELLKEKKDEVIDSAKRIGEEVGDTIKNTNTETIKNSIEAIKESIKNRFNGGSAE